MPLITQPNESTIEAISARLVASAASIDVAAAYATFSGTKLLFDQSNLTHLKAMGKRFLVGVDWFRSEPSALNMLQSLPSSQVRIADGDYLINGRMCCPRRTFHPKAYLIKGAPNTLIVGSANLSANGLKRSIELSLASTATPEIKAFSEWYNIQWSNATPWKTICDSYAKLYTREKAKQFVVTEDDDIPDPDVLRLRWVTPEKLRILRAAQNLWVDVGGLHNRDLQGLPGTDLQFTQMTRVFFGCPAVIVPGNKHLKDVSLTMRNATPQTRPMVFNKSSSMDRLSLPLPAEGGWPDQYDYKTLLFSKSRDGSFEVRVAASGDRDKWAKASERFGFSEPMQRHQRAWGTF